MPILLSTGVILELLSEKPETKAGYRMIFQLEVGVFVGKPLQYFNNLGIFSSRFKILSRLLETSTVRRRYSREKRSNFLLFSRLFVIQKVAFSRLFLNMENIEILPVWSIA